MSERVSRLLNHIQSSAMAEQEVVYTDDDVVIISSVRTPMGAFNGALSTVPAPQLAGITIKEALNRANVDPKHVDEVYFGCALQANVGQNPARQALIAAGIPNTCPATTVNKVCASGMKALAIGMSTIKMGYNQLCVVGGMENMSLAPHMVEKYRSGCKMGNQVMKDAMVSDGLTDAFEQCHMGTYAELCAEKHQVGREEQDEFARQSCLRATQNRELMADEIVPVPVPQRRGDPVIVSIDEPPTKVNLERLPKLRPAFQRDGGTVTAGNASVIADGAATLIICSGAKARELGVKPLAKVLSYADAAHDPKMFTTAPAKAVPLALQRAGLSAEDLNDQDYFELNEAFSVVGVVNTKLLNCPPERTNVFGGGVSMGHPLGCSGARILVTLLNVLQKKGGRYGIAGICNGGGGATAIVIQRIP